MAMKKMVMMPLVIFVMAASLGLVINWVEAQVHHVVGGDPGWDPSSDVASWSSHRRFTFGDKIWDAYSAAEEGIVEQKSKDEYESCNVKNPIRMYTDGLDGIELDMEGIRYFVSSNHKSCKKGPKLHVEVMPLGSPEMSKDAAVSENSISTVVAAAVAPTSPSESVKLCGNFLLLLIGLWLCTCIAIFS